MTDGAYKLPSGWRGVWLGGGGVGAERRDSSKKPEASFIYVDIAAIDNTTAQIVLPRELKGAEASSRARKVIQAGDVIFATTRPYLKNIALVPLELDNQICSTGFCVVRTNLDFVDPKYFFLVVPIKWNVAQIEEKMGGARFPGVPGRGYIHPLFPPPAFCRRGRNCSHLGGVDGGGGGGQALTKRGL